MLSILKRNFHYFFLVVLSFLLYLPSINGFFQHDEWSTFAELIVLRKESLFATLRYLFWPDVAHYTPIERIAFFLEFNFFKLNFSGYIFLSLFLNVIVVLLVYILGKHVFKSKVMGFISALIFLISSASFQAVTWVAASIGTELATIFALLSFVFFIKYFNIKNKFDLFLWISFYFFSVLSKEIAIFLPVVFVFYYLNFRKTKNKLDYKFILYPSFTFLSYVVVRILFFFLPRAASAQYVALRTQSLLEILYNFLSFPFKAISQSIVPVYTLIFVSQRIGIYFGVHSESIIETNISEFVSFFIFIIILLISFLIFRKNKKIGKIILLGLFFVMINSFIYAFSPGRIGVVTFIDSRNLYFPMIGIAIILTSIFSVLIYFSKTRVLFLLIIFFIFLNFNNFKIEFSNLTNTGLMRQKVLSQVLGNIKFLPKKTVIYTQSDTSFYGMPESDKILPFETGFGQIMLIEYEDKSNSPKSFFENSFLQEILDQGYKKQDESAFGYFRDLDDLKIAYENDKFSADDVIAFQYRFSDNSIMDITSQTQEVLRNFKAIK